MPIIILSLSLNFRDLHRLIKWKLFPSWLQQQPPLKVHNIKPLAFCLIVEGHRPLNPNTSKRCSVKHKEKFQLQFTFEFGCILAIMYPGGVENLFSNYQVVKEQTQTHLIPLSDQVRHFNSSKIIVSVQ